jgi:hypothetical protein
LKKVIGRKDRKGIFGAGIVFNSARKRMFMSRQIIELCGAYGEKLAYKVYLIPVGHQPGISWTAFSTTDVAALSLCTPE